jgi:hypothetical protein
MANEIGLAENINKVKSREGKKESCNFIKIYNKNN